MPRGSLMIRLLSIREESFSASRTRLERKSVSMLRKKKRCSDREKRWSVCRTEQLTWTLSGLKRPMKRLKSPTALPRRRRNRNMRLL